MYLTGNIHLNIKLSRPNLILSELIAYSEESLLRTNILECNSSAFALILWFNIVLHFVIKFAYKLCFC